MHKIIRIVRSAIFTIVILTPCFCAMAGSVPDTGQTKCYNDSVEITCPEPGEDFYGQDAQYQLNPPSFTKLDAQGNDLPNTANSWVMVRDNVTGLIWENKRDMDGNIFSYSNTHDADNSYTWYDSNPDTNGGDAGNPGDGRDTEDFIHALNSDNFGGFSDWRLPTTEELLSIVDYERYDPSIDTTYFPNTKLWYYWSSTTKVRFVDRAWRVSFEDGGDDWDYKRNSRYVRAVRGGQSEKIYVDNSDGTVTDVSTGLVWQQATAGPMDWKSALKYCERLTLGGCSNWRLPNIKELASIVDLSKAGPSIDTTYFPNAIAYYYFSSTTSAAITANVNLLDFNSGYIDNFPKSYDFIYVRAVRAGECVESKKMNMPWLNILLDD